MAVTYTTIASTTLTGTNSTITLGSIPQSYTDLRLVFYLWDATGGAATAFIRPNNDSSSVYGQQTFSAYSSNQKLTTRLANNNRWNINIRQQIPVSLDQSMYGWVDFFGYAGSTRKTVFWYLNINNGMLERSVGTMTGTSAITSINIEHNIGSFGAGSRATLYGILRA